MICTVLAVAALVVPSAALAQMLEVRPVTEGVWAIVGEKEQRSPENLGNNATFGLVVTNEGAVLIDTGGSWQGAKALHDAIRTVNDQPVTYVINTGGQDHRWLGNSYWQAQGASVIASFAAIKDQLACGSVQLSGLAQLIGERLVGTTPTYADVSFANEYSFDLGALTFESPHPGCLVAQMA